MGAVYLAQQAGPIRRVAVKVLLPNAMMNSEVYNEFLARFQREANLIAQLEHINIMPIYEYGEQDGLAYLVMPYLTGGSLHDVLAQRGTLSLRETMIYIDQAASALDYAHAHKVIHRDLKPGNFLLHADGRLVLADFGIARMMQDSSGIAGSTLTGTGMFLGTPEYMAPEMARGEHIDHRADIYELGIVLFQMLSGTVPFKGNSPLIVAAKQMQEPFPSVHSINPALPPAVDAVLQQATAKNPEDRFTTAGAMAQALRSAINSPLETDTRNAPTVLSSPRPIAPTVITPQNNTPPAQQVISATPAPQRNEHSSGGFSPTLSAYPITAPGWRRPASSNMQPWLIFIGLLLVIALVVGGVLIGLQLNRGNGTNPSSGAVTTPNVSQNSSTTTANPSVGKTVSTTSVPTLSPTPTARTVQTDVIPRGSTVYYTSEPGALNDQVNCDGGGETWANYNFASVVCHPSNVQISNSQTQLAGTLLLYLNGKTTYPTFNYVVEAQLQQIPNSHADFGIYFRNQPGHAQGIYTFLISTDGSWSCYVYDNKSGLPTKITSGATGVDAYSPLLIDVVVKGANFTFYINEHQVGNARDTTYSMGTAGIAVDPGGTIFASDFALYTIAP